MSSKPIYKNNPYEYDFTVRKKNDATGALEPVTGLTDLKGVIAASAAGAAIHADLELTLAERTSKPGQYFAIVPTAAINARLFGVAPANYEGQLVYVCARNPDVDVSDPVPVFATRQAG